MADYVKDPETGEVFVLSVTGEPIPVQAGDIKELEAGSLEQFGRAAVRGVGTLATGAGSLLNAAGMETFDGAREKFDELGRQGAVQGAVNPIQQTGAFAPDIAAGIATGGGSLLGTLGRTAAVEGALGAMRNPDEPIRGAATQAAIGATAAFGGALLAPVVVGGIKVGTKAGNQLRNRFGNVAESVVQRSRAQTDSINAARNASPEYSSGGRILGGQNTVAQMDELALDLGMKQGDLYTSGMERQLNATTKAEMDAGTALREQEELFSTNVALDRTGGGGKSINQVKDNIEEAGTQVVMRELGENLESRMTWQNMQRLEDEIVQPFKEAQEQAGPIKLETGDTSAIDDIVVRAEANDERLLQNYIDNMNDDIAKGGGELKPKDAQQLRTRLGKDILSASKNGQAARAGSLSDLRDVLDSAMERNLDGETLEALTDARHKYRVLKSVQRSTATTGGGGKLNIRSFINAWQRSGNNQYGRTSKGSEAFNRNLETLQNLNEKITPSSGTAQRLIAGAASGPIGTALGAGATAAAGVGLLGD